MAEDTPTAMTAIETWSMSAAGSFSEGRHLWGHHAMIVSTRQQDAWQHSHEGGAPSDQPPRRKRQRGGAAVHVLQLLTQLIHLRGTHETFRTVVATHKVATNRAIAHRRR